MKELCCKVSSYDREKHLLSYEKQLYSKKQLWYGKSSFVSSIAASNIRQYYNDK